MFPFSKKKPPSKVEIVKQTVSNAAHSLLEALPSEAIEDKFDDLKKTAVHVALQAAQVAHHAGEVASNRLEGFQQAAASLGETAAVKAHLVSDTASTSASTAKDALQNRAATLRDSAYGLKDSALALKNSLQERAVQDMDAGKVEAENAKAAAKAVGQKVAKQGAEAATAKLEEGKKKLAAKKDDILAEVPQIESPIQVEYTDQTSKWLWILLGVAVGVVLAILFAPTSGRRSRAAIKDRLGKVGEGVADAASAASDKAGDIVNRAEGLAHKAGVKLASDVEGDDDATITDRVKSILGHNEVTKHIERLNVDTAAGVVTLRGPMLDPAAQEIIINAVKAVSGVKEVVADFLTDDEPADASTYAS